MRRLHPANTGATAGGVTGEDNAAGGGSGSLDALASGSLGDGGLQGQLQVLRVPVEG